MKRRIAILALAFAVACGPPPGLPPYTDLAASIPWGSTDSNHASIIQITGENWGYAPGTVLRVTQQDRAFVGNHGGYTMIIENA